jgi:hypothetical protein
MKANAIAVFHASGPSSPSEFVEIHEVYLGGETAYQRAEMVAAALTKEAEEADVYVDGILQYEVYDAPVTQVSAVSWRIEKQCAPYPVGRDDCARWDSEWEAGLYSLLMGSGTRLINQTLKECVDIAIKMGKPGQLVVHLGQSTWYEEYVQKEKQ